MSPHQPLVARFRRQLAFALTCKYSLALGTAWVFLWGTLVLLLRATTDVPSTVLLCGGVVLPACIITGVVLALRQMPSPQAVQALLDSRNRLGGILMAAEETDVSAWNELLTIRRVPQVSWDSQRAWLLFGCGLAFVVAGFAAPRRFAAPREMPLELGQEIERLKEQVEALKEERVLDSARADEMKARLDELKQNGKGTDPVKTLEAIDHVQEQAKNRAKAEAEAALKKTEQLAKAQELADALNDPKPANAGGLNEKTRKESMQELARRVGEARKENDKLADRLDSRTVEALEKGTASAAQIEQVKAALEEAKRDVGKTMERLARVGLVEPDKLAQIQNAARGDGKGLREFLKENEGKAATTELLAARERTGQGSSTKTPGAGDLTFGRDSDDLTARMKAQVLPQGRLDALKENKARGLSLNTTVPETPGGGATSGAPSGTTGGSGSAEKEALLPRHRGAVERYFERGKN